MWNKVLNLMTVNLFDMTTMTSAIFAVLVIISVQWRSMVDLTTHAISGLCLDDVIMLSLQWNDIFRVPTQF